VVKYVGEKFLGMIVLVVSKPQGLAALQSIHKAVGERVAVVTCDDKQDIGRSCFADILNYCRQNDLDFHVLTGASLNQFLIDNKPGFCFVSGWYWMIDERALDACHMGCFGVHNSLLPAYRGGAPLVWSMINGEAQVGATIFRMTKGMDDGEILHQWKIDVEPHWVITDVLDSIESSVAEEIGLIVVRYLNGGISLRAQSDIGVSYAPQRREGDSEVNWGMSAEDIFNHSRALQPPYPRLYFVKKDQKCQIYNLQKAPFRCFGKSGKVLAYIEAGLVVKCGVNNTDGVIISDIRFEESPDVNLLDSRYFTIGAVL